MNYTVKRWVNENEASMITGVSVQTLRNWRSQGKAFNYTKVGRSVRYAVNDLHDYMEAHKIKRT
ncbi:MAG: helix-turn-helix domain-containing protein [Deltaproteobacteria bacterium]|nr:helix-turn-helix domain-containing protein [Deltaproteobacteria bacterium]MBN2844652.1 helix-turn-helix domain-containing protein [Deltaproteobacteria bacterium]